MSRPKIEAKGRDRGGVLGEGVASPLPPTGGPGERCELPQRGSGRSLDCPKVFHHFQYSGWPDTTILLTVDHHAAIGGGGKTSVVSPHAYAPPWFITMALVTLQQ